MDAQVRRGKGKYCVAYGCSSTYYDNVSLHLFPRGDKRPEIRRQWIAFVRARRKDFDGPSEFMCLCEKHFDDSCYPRKYFLMKSMGKEEEIGKKTLLPDAVPTIHAVEQAATVTPHPIPACSSSSNASDLTDPKPGPSFTSPRSAYRKRECLRILDEFDKTAEEEEALASCTTGHDVEIEGNSHIYQSLISRGTQSRLRVPGRSVSSQLSKPKQKSTGSPYCPVASFEFYLSRLHPKCDRLWQRPRERHLVDDELWFRNTAIGEKCMSTFMTKLSKAVGTSRVYSNQSLRVTPPTALLKNLGVTEPLQLKNGDLVSIQLQKPQQQVVQQNFPDDSPGGSSDTDGGQNPVQVKQEPADDDDDDDDDTETETPALQNIPSITVSSEDDPSKMSQTATACHLCGLISINRPLWGLFGNASQEMLLISKYFGQDQNFEQGSSICPSCETSLYRLSEIESELQSLEQKLWERICVTTRDGTSRFDKLYAKYIERKNKSLCNQLVTNGKEGYFAYVDDHKVVCTGTPLAEKYLAENVEELTKLERFCRSRSKSSSPDNNRQIAFTKSLLNAATYKNGTANEVRTGSAPTVQRSSLTTSQGVPQSIINVSTLSPPNVITLAQQKPQKLRAIAKKGQKLTTDAPGCKKQKVVQKLRTIAKKDQQLPIDSSEHERELLTQKTKDAARPITSESEIPSKRLRTTESSYTEKNLSFKNCTSPSVVNESQTTDGKPVLEENVEFKVEPENDQDYDPKPTSTTSLSLSIMSTTENVYSVKKEPVPVMLVGNYSALSEAK